MARQRVDEITGVRAFVSEAIDILSVAKGETQAGLCKGSTNYYRSDSTLFTDCFAEKPRKHIDPHQQIIRINANQKIQFAKAVGWKVSLATFGMLEDLLLKVSFKTRKPGGSSGEFSNQSH